MSRKFGITLLKFVKSIDLLAQPFQFQVKNKRTVQSFLGGVFTLLMIGILLFFAYTFGCDIFYKSKPNIIMLNDYLNYFPRINYTEKNTLFAFRLEDLYGYPIQNYSNYINVSISYSKKSILEEGGYHELISIPISFDRCNYNSTFGFLFDKNLVESYYCIKNYDIDIGGFWGGNQFVNYLSVQVNKCKNSSQNNNTCRIIDQDKQLYFNLYISDSNVGLLNKDNYTNYKLTNIYTMIDEYFYKVTDFKYSIIELITDSGFFFNSIDNRTELFLDTISDDFIKNSNNILAEYNFFLSKRKQRIIRSYIKLQEIGAQLGGITQILILFFSFIIQPFQEKKLYSSLMNQLFRFSSHELADNLYFQKLDMNENSVKKLINSLNGTKSMNYGSPESHKGSLISIREKVKEDKIQLILKEIKNSKKFHYSKCELILSTYLCKMTHPMPVIKKDLIIKKSQKYLNKFLNIDTFFEKILEFEIVKFLLLSNEQIKTLNFLDKPEIFIEETNHTSNFMKIIDTSKEINKDITNEVVEYFLRSINSSNEIDSKLFDLIPSKLKELILSLK